MQVGASPAMEDIEIYEETYDKLKAVCSEYDVTIAAIVGELVENYLDDALESYGVV